MKKHEFALESFKNIQELIKFTDQKSGAVLVVAGFILTAFLELAKDLTFSNSISAVGILTFIFGLCTVGFLISVIYISICLVIKPRLANNYNPNEHSLYYFEHLAKMGRDLINSEFDNLNIEDHPLMLKNILDQTFVVSEVLTKKIKYVERSMNMLFYSVLSLLAFILTTKLV